MCQILASDEGATKDELTLLQSADLLFAGLHIFLFLFLRL